MIDPKIEQLFKEHFHVAVHVARKIVASRHVAEDIVQDVFIRMLEMDMNTLSSPVNFLYTSARNGAIDYTRRNARLVTSIAPPDMADSDSMDTLAGEIEHAENLARLLRAIEQLPEQSRKVVELICLSNCSYNDAASRLGISVSTIKTHMYRSLKKLRDLL
jgi:RNA polymerase sigma-70 factor (ECF subfamily)